MSQYRWHKQSYLAECDQEEQERECKSVLEYANDVHADIERAVQGMGEDGDALRIQGFSFDVLWTPDGEGCPVELNSFGAPSGCGSALFHWIADVEVLYGRDGKGNGMDREAYHCLSIRLNRPVMIERLSVATDSIWCSWGSRLPRYSSSVDRTPSTWWAASSHDLRRLCRPQDNSLLPDYLLDLPCPNASCAAMYTKASLLATYQSPTSFAMLLISRSTCSNPATTVLL